MGLLFSWSLFLTLLLSASVADSVHGGNETDQLALLSFKAQITGDQFGTLNSWNESIHFCQWVGVTCGRRHPTRVTGLNLDHRKLVGAISPHIGNLSFLKELSLLNNSFSHEIPPQLGRLKRLQMLQMGNNSLTGEIPTNISGCSNLVDVDLGGNILSGKIPVELGSLSKLQVLGIDYNHLVGGIPSSIGNLSSLILFSVIGNRIGGSIPYALGKLKKLELLHLGENRLVGTIPSSIFNLSSLTVFFVGVNQLQGMLPSELGNTLPNLVFIEVSVNLFTGSIPISISNATKLYHIGFYDNKFTGKVPYLEKLNNLGRLVLAENHLGSGEANDLNFLNSLTNARNLTHLYLRSNNFGGLWPNIISNFSNLVIFQIDDNKIVGSIPTGIGNLVNLQGIGLSLNRLTGQIPSDIGKLQNLVFLGLFDNKFYGDIPSSIENLTRLTTLLLQRNNLHGSIPSTVGKCQMLVELILYRNNFIGNIPVEVMSLSSLMRLSISQNNLTGSLPIEIGSLKNLEELYVSKNMLSGEIPSSLGSCEKLRVLYMVGNKFSGTLPFSLSKLRGMEEIDISHNNFSGKIPDYFENFVFLHVLNLSFNDFEGVVPERGIYRNATAISVKGNNKLCGGIAELELQSCNSKGYRKKRSSLTMNLVISIPCGVLGLSLMLCFLYRYSFRKRANVSSFRLLGNPFLKLSYQSLLKATDRFSPTNLIGVGGFGSVYRGILDHGNKVVAIKVLHLDFAGALKSFTAECKALKNIKHRNLVKVLSACSSIDYQGNDFKALVYEFMVNGSLEEWLHPNENGHGVRNESRSLNLLQRLNIAIDVASALDYLHHYSLEPIVHCDLKPNNVLLDEEMVGHVADFGLARFLRDATCTSSVNQSSSIGIRGSVGYAAPEYGMGNEVSTLGDVYSYGILVLEMFTAKRPIDSMFIDGMTLHNFAKTALAEQVESIVDPTLLPHTKQGEASSSTNSSQSLSFARSHKIQEILISILNVGIACSEELPIDRSAMNEILTRLHGARRLFLEMEVVSDEV